MDSPIFNEIFKVSWAAYWKMERRRRRRMHIAIQSHVREIDMGDRLHSKCWNLYASPRIASLLLQTPWILLILARRCWSHYFPCLWTAFAFALYLMCTRIPRRCTYYISWCSTLVDCIIYGWFERACRWGLDAGLSICINFSKHLHLL